MRRQIAFFLRGAQRDGRLSQEAFLRSFLTLLLSVLICFFVLLICTVSTSGLDARLVTHCHALHEL